MFSYSLIKYWYIVLTILILFAPVKISILEFLPGLLLMWFLLFIFILGTLRVNQKNQTLSTYTTNSHRDTRKFAFTISLAFIFFIPIYVFFYTGNSLIDVIASISDTNNNYNNYQRFFEENNISNFSINKLPYIFCFAIIKFFASLIIIKIITFQKEKKIIDYISLLIITLSFLYSSLGRGTSFELFELIMIILYSFLLKVQLKKRKLSIPFKNIFQIISSALIALSYFIINISKRYGIESIIESDFEFISCSTNEFCIDKNSLLFKLIPAVSIALFQMANYFVFGIFFSSKLIRDVIFSSVGGFLSILIPNGSNLFFEKSYKNLVCDTIIDCGVNWIPDITTLLTNFGIIGTLLIIFPLGMFSVRIFKKISEGSLLGSLLLFYIVCFMISLPSGNFITSSSANQLCILFSFLLYLSPFEKSTYMNVIKSKKPLIIEQKILFLSNLPFADVGNNGKTFQSLFSDFENNQIAQLFFNMTTPSIKKFLNYYRITDINILQYIISFHSKKISGKINFFANNLNSGNSKLVSQNSPIKKLIRNFIFSRIKLYKLNSFNCWIEEFKPTVIFFVGTNYMFSYQILNYLNKFYKIPYFIYFTDDYFLYSKGIDFLSKIMHKRFVDRSKGIVQNAEQLFVISQKMKQEYEIFFQKKCTVLINAVDKVNFPDAKIKLANSITFRYFGGLHSNRSSSLRYIGECLMYLNDKYDLKCKLEIYTLTPATEKIKLDLLIDTIALCEPVIDNELKNKMSTSDFLVHAESFEPKDIQVTMLSISTKIPEYLLSNRCVIAIGPTQLASISIFKDNELGIVIEDKKSLNIHAESIYKVISDINLYNSYCKKSEAFYDNEFNASKMKQYLKNTLLNI